MTIDIVMPFYGRFDHFRAAVESVLHQSDSRWRLVVIDDHYPDTAPGEWLLSLGDPRIQYRRHAQNIGINANFQASIEAAKADWVVIFGCDDLLLPGYIARIMQLIEAHPRATFIHPGTRVVDEQGIAARPLVDRAKALYRPRGRGPRLLTGQELAVSVTRGNWMNFPAIAWKRTDLQEVGFRSTYRIVQDLALVIDLAYRGGTLLLDDEVVFEYRRHASSESSWRANDGSRFVEEQRFFRAIAAEYRARGWSRAERVARAHLSSRINALTRIPAARVSEDRGASRLLVRHALGLNVQNRDLSH